MPRWKFTPLAYCCVARVSWAPSASGVCSRMCAERTDRVRLAPEQTREGPSPPSSSFCGGRRARDGGKQRRRHLPLGSRWGAAPGSAVPAAPGPAACARAGGLPLRGAWARNLALVLKRSMGLVNLAQM